MKKIVPLLVAMVSMNGEQIEAPYGSWKSPITAEMIATNAIRLDKGKEIGDAVIFSESRASEKGRTVLVRFKGGTFEDLFGKDFNARTTVHEYGGGSYLIDGKIIYFSNFADQQLYRRGPDGLVEQFTNAKNCRFADGCAGGNFLFYVMEEHGNEVENCLVAIDPSGKVKKIARGADFYSRPRVSPNGKKLAYYSWNHPNMPWDGGELRVAALNKDGTLGEDILIAGSDSESISSHAWGPDGKLYYVSDASGWWNLYCEGKAICPMEAEIGFPQWNFGETDFDFWEDKIVFIYSKNAEDHLALLRGGVLEEIEIPFKSIQNLSITGDHLYFVGSSPKAPTALIKYNLKTHVSSVVKESGELPFSDEYISEPTSIEFPTEGGLSAHALYYPPQNRDYRGLEGEKPPLLVISHGGPTAHNKPSFNLQIQYWTSRGIAVIDVNYGGSSGYGRAYRQRLNHNWGIVDVNDCTNAALYCAAEGLADRKRLSIAGGSAGGFTTLACLAFKDVFKAGASYFGVSDLEALTLDTHKFEARYLDLLISPYPQGKKIYQERSPIHSIDKIRCPIILLQGDEDKIVPPSQSEKMYLSLLERGIPTAYLLFEKEQHGFRQADHIKRALEAHYYFFSRIFGFEIADRIEPLKISNL